MLGKVSTKQAVTYDTYQDAEPQANTVAENFVNVADDELHR